MLDRWQASAQTSVIADPHPNEGRMTRQGERPPGPGRMSYLPKEMGSHRKAPVRRGVSPIRTAAPL